MELPQPTTPTLLEETPEVPARSMVRMVGVLALVMALLAAGGVWTTRVGETGASEPDGPVPPPDPNRTRPATLESAWPTVAGRAGQWDDEARLLSLSAQYDWPIAAGAGEQTPSGGWLIYVFVRGRGDQTESLAIMVERNGAVIARETTSVLGTDATGIDHVVFEQAGVGSMDALEIATETMGRSFRAECPARRYVTRQSFQPGMEGHPARWVITYGDSRVRNGPALIVIVDAATGDARVDPFDGSDPPLDGLPACEE